MNHPWWRIEYDSQGKAFACLQVEFPVEDAVGGGLVLYVQAVDESHAWRVAARVYSRRKVAAQRAKYRAEGKCNCGRAREDKEFLSCRVCRSNHAATLERREGRSPGIDSTAQRLEKSAARTRDSRAEMRHEVLVELEVKLSTFQSITAARLWARQEIRKLQGLPNIERAGAGNG